MLTADENGGQALTSVRPEDRGTRRGPRSASVSGVCQDAEVRSAEANSASWCRASAGASTTAATMSWRGRRQRACFCPPLRSCPKAHHHAGSRPGGHATPAHLRFTVRVTEFMGINTLCRALAEVSRVPKPRPRSPGNPHRTLGPSYSAHAEGRTTVPRRAGPETSSSSCSRKPAGNLVMPQTCP